MLLLLFRFGVYQMGFRYVVSSAFFLGRGEGEGRGGYTPHFRTLFRDHTSRTFKAL